MAWLDEHLRFLRNANGPVVVQAGPAWGTFELIAELGSPTRPLLWLNFSSGSDYDSISQGVQLSDAIRRAFGSPLFGYGVPVEHGLSILRRYSALLGPIYIAVTGADRASALTDGLVAMSNGTIKLVLVVEGPLPNSWKKFLRRAELLLTEDDLRLTRAQALELAGSDICEEDLDRIFSGSRGAFIPFIEARHELLGLPAPRFKRVDREEAELPAAPTREEVFQILLGREKWMEALELAVHELPGRVHEVIDQAGDMYFDRGLFEGLWRLLSRLPTALRRTEQVLYWVFAASIAVGRQEEVISSVEDFLSDTSAPELRALYAASGFSRNPVEEAERAYKTKKSAITANFYGFVMATHIDPAGAIPYLEEALDLFEKRENNHRVVSTAISICDAYINLGEYSNAASWASWALKEFAERDLREELLRYHAVSLLAYVRLLLGEVEKGSSLLEPIELSEEIFGIPSMEAVVSTMGDYALVKGDAQGALRFYEIIYKRFGRRLGPYAVNDMVRALIHLGDFKRARQYAYEAVALSAGSNAYEKQRALLALGTAEGVIAPKKAVRLLADVLGHYETALNAPALAQAGLHLAMAHLRLGDTGEARGALFRADAGLRQLAKSGWLLLGGPEEEIHQVWDLWNEDSTPIELRFMGSRRLRIQHRTLDYPLRWCEILAVLAFHPEGLNGERLSLLLYGDGGNMSTLKSNLSRMRKDVPVSSRPYQIELPCTADFVVLDKALREGRVREALELYHGPLLPESEAPFVVETRDYLEETLRQAALNSGDVEVLLSLARKLGDDLELWEAASKKLSQNDPLLPLAKAHVKRIQRSWGG